MRRLHHGVMSGQLPDRHIEMVRARLGRLCRTWLEQLSTVRCARAAVMKQCPRLRSPTQNWILCFAVISLWGIVAEQGIGCSRQ
jgi:hypothetical protein